MTVVCVIPALNAASSLESVIAGLRASVPAAAIVGIDDGSTDATGRIFARCADRVESFQFNRGKGAALRAGFRHAADLGATCVLSIDADGQHDPSCAPALLAGLDHADVVVGARGRDASVMPFRRRVSNAWSSAAISAIAGRPLPDTQCGYRAIRREVIDAVQAVGDRYEYETDFIIRAARLGYRISAVPVPTIYIPRHEGGRSHFRECRDAARVVATILRHRLRTAT
ncbi:MAG: glycosyltransferase family 2 protein [Gemmatimonadaceae bacterium]